MSEEDEFRKTPRTRRQNVILGVVSAVIAAVPVLYSWWVIEKHFSDPERMEYPLVYDPVGLWAPTTALVHQEIDARKACEKDLQACEASPAGKQTVCKDKEFGKVLVPYDVLPGDKTLKDMLRQKADAHNECLKRLERCCKQNGATQVQRRRLVFR